MPKAPPKFVTSVPAWEYTLAKLELKGKLTPNGDPQNYAAACAIYKNVVRKYPAFSTPENEVERRQNLSLDQLIEEYAEGTMFWFDDVLCEAQAHPVTRQTINSDSEGNLRIYAKALDVDPEGAHRDWEGLLVMVDPARCADFVEAAA